MKNIIVLIFIGLVILLGYSIYLDSKMKKKEQVTKIVSDAEQSLKLLENNPNYNQRSSLYQANHPNVVH